MPGYMDVPIPGWSESLRLAVARFVGPGRHELPNLVVRELHVGVLLVHVGAGLLEEILVVAGLERLPAVAVDHPHVSKVPLHTPFTPWP
jgi:hypothetical protein